MEPSDFLSRLNGVKRSGDNKYIALCPAHGDTNPSLGITVQDGRICPHCFAGCETERILDAMGLQMRDLYFGDRQYKAKISDSSPSNDKLIFTYCDEDGTLLYTKTIYYDKEIPTDGSKRKKHCSYRQPDGTRNLKNAKRVPFQLHLFKESELIFIVEGEKCATAVTNEGYVATTLDSGANSKWQEEYLKYFDGKQVLIIPDNDTPGLKYACMLKKHITWAKIKQLPDLETSEDIYDWLKKGHKIEEIEALPEYIPTEKDKTSEDKQKQSEMLLEILNDKQICLFLDENHEPCAKVKVGKHYEVFPIESENFYYWAQRAYYQERGSTMRADNLKQSVSELVAEAKFGDTPTIHLFNRVARKDDKFWYDLTNPDWQAVKVSSGKWEVTDDYPTLFRRFRHQKAQVMPQKGGDIERIFDYVHVGKFKLLFLCWLVSCFVPEIPHPVMIFYGEKGATKSTTCILIKKLIDPSVLDSLTLRKDERSLLVNLQTHYYLPFDNVSSISPEVSDTLCRAVTGGAVQQRKLFTDAEDYIFNFMRCLTINGINNVANRADLLDRSIMVELMRVREDKRRELQEVYESFEVDRPYILGAIFDILSKAMEIYPTVKLERLPRMADFCRWGYAIGEAIGGNGDKFITEYMENQTLQNDEAINADAVAYLTVELMRFEMEWSGRISELHKKLKELAESNGISLSAKSLPQSPSHLTRRLKAVKCNLEAVGIEFVIETNHSDGTHIVLKNKNISPLPSYQISVGKILGEHGSSANGGNHGDGSILRDSSIVLSPEDLSDDGDNGDNGDTDDCVEF